MLEIIFIHIPKTAGSSVLEIIRQNYHESEIQVVKRGDFKENANISPSEFLRKVVAPETKVLLGHFTFREVEPLVPDHPGVKIITFLREPVHRVISNFLFFKQRILTGKVPDKLMKRASETLLDYARLDQSQNRMSFFLDGIDLKSLFFVGLMESFDEDIAILTKALGLHIDSVPNANKNRFFNTKDFEISPEELVEIKALNSEDVKLYERAIELRNKNLNR
nr:sulfotransferase family 2 domain-containing protein [Saprospiraceae bacterium]